MCWMSRQSVCTHLILSDLQRVMHDLVSDGNSVILVDHDTQILKEADWIVEMGPEAGANGGHVIAQGTIADVEANPASQIGPFISGKAETTTKVMCQQRKNMFSKRKYSFVHISKYIRSSRWKLTFQKADLPLLQECRVRARRHLVLESLIPALDANINGT